MLIEFVRNQAVADHCELHLGQMNGFLVAAHAVHFHDGERQAYLPVLPCDLPLGTILRELPIPPYLGEFFAIFDQNNTDVSNINWGNLQCGIYSLSFRGIFFATFTITDIQENDNTNIEISPTLPLFPRDLEREFAADDAFFLRALHHGYVHAAEYLTQPNEMLKGDCVFFAFDGTFRALLPGTAYDKLRSIPPLHGEIFTAQYTALHHQAAVQTLGLPGLVCVKESSMQAIADLGLIILVITDPAKLEGCFISTTSILTPTDISSKVSGNFKFTKHNMVSITHFEPLRVQAGDIVHVCEQPSGKLVKTSFPSLRLEYFERTAHCCASILQPIPDEDDYDPIIDASDEDTH